MIGDWVYFALLWAALAALPGAARAVPMAWQHWREAREGHPGRDVAASSGALLVSLGITLHALEEIGYKSGRIWQLYHGVDTYNQASFLLIAAGLAGVASLSLAVHYLNQKTSKWVRAYWLGQMVLGLAMLLTRG